jgi:hypothetical protein
MGFEPMMGVLQTPALPLGYVAVKSNCMSTLEQCQLRSEMKYAVTALEKFTHCSIYSVEANNPEEAEQKARSGEVAYERTEITDDGDEWIEMSSIEELP